MRAEPDGDLTLRVSWLADIVFAQPNLTHGLGAGRRWRVRTGRDGDEPNRVRGVCHVMEISRGQIDDQRDSDEKYPGQDVRHEARNAESSLHRHGLRLIAFLAHLNALWNRIAARYRCGHRTHALDLADGYIRTIWDGIHRNLLIGVRHRGTATREAPDGEETQHDDTDTGRG